MGDYTGLERIGKIIPRYIDSRDEAFKKKYSEHFAMSKWREIVGDPIANNVKPVAINNNVLWLLARTTTWQDQIKHMESTILDRMNNRAGKTIVRQICFRRLEGYVNWKSPVYRVRQIKDDQAKARREIRKMQIDDGELAAMKETCAQVKDDDLQRVCLKAMIANRKLRKWRNENKWHPCARCGCLCEEDDVLCSACQSKREADIRRRVRAVLMDMPWAHYGEVREVVPDCTPYIVNDQRALLVQKYAKKIRFEDKDTLDAKFLVMLHRSIQPEQLTEDIISKTLYALRRDLVRPTEFKPFKRQDFMLPHKRKIKKKPRK